MRSQPFSVWLRIQAEGLLSKPEGLSAHLELESHSVVWVSISLPTKLPAHSCREVSRTH
jgi:hypothetical protein